MKRKIKNQIKSNKKLYKIAELINMLKNSRLKSETGLKKKYPKVIQLPITYNCNAKCIMCNIPNMNCKDEITPKDLENILKDNLFKKIEAVGINGGEPFLKNDIEEYVEKVLELPNLKSFNIISNGFSTKIILEKLEKIYKLCKNKGVYFHVSFSLDGVGETHDIIRGIPGVFNKTILTLDSVYSEKEKYCDSIDVGCTISRQNVNNLVELEVFSKLKKYDMKYRLAISNKRIDSKSKLENFSVLLDEKSKQTAKEFFQKQITLKKTLNEMYKYWSIYMFLSEKMPKRYMGCAWKENGITLDAEGNIYYCAVESKNIGNVRNKRLEEEFFFSRENLAYRNTIINEKCEKCIHDYSGKIKTKNIIKFILFAFNKMFWIKTYKKEFKK